jgi:hypothetical protein
LRALHDGQHRERMAQQRRQRREQRLQDGCLLIWRRRCDVHSRQQAAQHVVHDVR